MMFLLLVRGGGPVALDPDALDRDLDERFKGIRCPRCGWQPRPSDRWVCSSQGAPEYFPHGCDTVWNTFHTSGRCPGCSHQWRFTSCLACQEWSHHGEWYDQGG
jgi:hypothetical protein